MKELKVNLSNHGYSIYIGNNILDSLSDYISKVYTNKKVFIVTDDNVAEIYLKRVTEELSKKYEVDSVIIPHGEESKTIDIYARICSELLDKNIRRKNLLVALGGGVIGDMTGFVAATLFRGIPYVGIPTSLLSQMDSSIGGKTGIDYYNRKNILGAFKQPEMVIIDPMVLKTLPDVEFSNGMAELIKHAAIGNAPLFEVLKNKPEIDEDVISESLKVKRAVVEIDEFDTGDRMKLNFGHTFGHAIELKYGLKHGQAVAIGMLMAIKMGEDLGVTPAGIYEPLKTMLELFGLPTDEYNYKYFIDEVMGDKKNIAGTISFILLDKIGSCQIVKMTEEELKKISI